MGQTSALTAIRPRSLPPWARRLRVLLVAKHAAGDGAPHPTDGTHAVYHCEMREALAATGVELLVADSYQVLFDPPAVDFVFPLLNRGGFLNSEMLLPLLCQRAGLPYLGASPILRGLADDKHLAKLTARSRGLPTAPWAIYRQGAAVTPDACPDADRYVVKPNASSASWGLSAASSWAEVRAAVEALHAEGHDVIVEPFVAGHDLEVSVLTLHGEPCILPVQIVEQDDPDQLRTYAEKRDLGVEPSYRIRPLVDPDLDEAVRALSLQLAPEFLPFDYGRFEFRLDLERRRPLFMEVNLNCNLWSRKTIAMAARQLGWSHRELVETILTESLERHGLLERRLELAA